MDDFVYLKGDGEPKIRRSRIKGIKIIIGKPYKTFDEEFGMIIHHSGVEVYYFVNVRSDENHVYRDWRKEEELYKRKEDISKDNEIPQLHK